MDKNNNIVILFAEDDEQIRYITSEMLKSEGYTVLAAENGELAYNLGLRHLQEIDILLTDLHMHKTKGGDLIELLLADRPDLKILISSGYIKNVKEKIVIQDREIPFLIKPYTRQALMKELDKLLNS